MVHDLNLAAQYADRILVLKDGEELTTGGPAEVFTQGVIEQAFKVGVQVIPHPALDCPLIVPLPKNSEKSRTAQIAGGAIFGPQAGTSFDN